MRSLFPAACCALLLPLPALAENTPRQSFDALASCVSARDASACRQEITASSVSLYDRFASYGLMRCLPADAQYVSQQDAGNHTLIRARTGKKTMRLYFVEEEAAWKLDVPYTLEQGMGPNWEKQVNSAEQVYVLMKQSMGAKLNCEALAALFPDKEKTTPAKQ